MAMTPLSQAVLQGMLLQRQQAPPDPVTGSPNWTNLLPGTQPFPNGNKNTPELDPGVRWGGKDKNAVQPNDFMTGSIFGRYTNSETP